MIVRLQMQFILVSCWLYARKLHTLPFKVGAFMIALTMAFMPWWGRLVALGGICMIVWGAELESVSARIDGANTMAFLMENEEGNGS